MQYRAMITATQSRLHVEYLGQGQPVVLLHGWGMHTGIFAPLATQLAHRHTVAAVDLPGHGESEAFEQFANITRLSDYLVSQMSALLREGVILVGWSMGGLLAQSIAAQYPAYVKKLVLLSSTPCFTQRDDWQFAMDHSALSVFAGDLLQDFAGTLSRFLALQFKGAQDPKENLRRARALVFTRPQPRAQTLQQGLQLLDNTDLRRQLKQITCPTLVINGERDTLVPSASARYLSEQVTHGRCVILKGAGHAPFLSHPQAVTYFMERFVHEH